MFRDFHLRLFSPTFLIPTDTTDQGAGLMADKLKKYCPRCGDRVSRSATRCHHCGQRLITRRLLIIYAAIAAFIGGAIFLLLRYF